nr:alkyl hydroperoxide reductase subunit F [uncultured Desulfobacter sp.]
MLEPQILEQLKTVFEKLEGRVDLIVSASKHEKQAELVQMLEQVAGTSEKIRLIETKTEPQSPGFHLRHNGRDCGIVFSGIPGGHEFTSLVLAILNADHKGKLPDPPVVDRIRALKGPIHLSTYVSLSCENCPEVVQALNMMAVFHPGITHEMVDGGFFQHEVEALGLQGVPSVIHDKTLISSGKTDLVQLLDKLEDRFGVDPSVSREPVDLGVFDVAVVGGGPAGASAAIYAARKGLKTVLVAERIGGQVKDTKGIENLISVPYTEGAQLADKLARHISSYDIKVLEHRRLAQVKNGEPKDLALDSGENLTAGALIVATGAKWRTLGVPGEKDYTGRGVAFCPHCDGPFYKGRDIAVIGGGNSGVEAAIDLAGIVRSVTVFEFLPDLKADRVLVNKMTRMANVSVKKNVQVIEVLGDGEKVTGLKYRDRQTGAEQVFDLSGIFVQIGLLPNSDCISRLVETNRLGEVVVDDGCRTSARGIYAAGDVTSVPYKQIVISMGEGAKAALSAFEQLVLQTA